jgi:hypothetical protein
MTYKILILIAKRLFHTFSFHGSFFNLYFTASATAQPIINIYLSVHQKKEICEIFTAIDNINNRWNPKLNTWLKILKFCSARYSRMMNNQVYREFFILLNIGLWICKFGCLFQMN